MTNPVVCSAPQGSFDGSTVSMSNVLEFLTKLQTYEQREDGDDEEQQEIERNGGI